MPLSPFSLMRRMFEDMDRLFEDAAAGGAGNRGMRLAGEGQGAQQLGVLPIAEPKIDVRERDGNLVVRVDLPGVNADDIIVSLEDDALVITAERRQEREDRGEGFYVAERAYGTFQRRIPLPSGVAPEAIVATYDNGVLEIVVALPQEAAGRRIDVKSGGTEQQQQRPRMTQLGEQPHENGPASAPPRH
jgi:HSP20 family protein